MRIVRGIGKLRVRRPTAATIGIFDGVHRGHKKILRLLLKSAKKMKAKSCVITFDPHPSKILHPRRIPPMLISTKHKLDLLAAEGVDIAVLIRFTKKFAAIKHADFVNKVLVEKMNVKELLVGENFFFGSGRSGTVKRLKELGKRCGFAVRVVTPLRSGKKIISSTLIRKLITSGRLKEAKKKLGREVSILGTVTRGTRRGRILGFPTANLDLHHEAIPPSGVYIVRVKIDEKIHQGIMNIGFRPTFAATEREIEPTAEVHILRFRKDIYGKDIEVIFLRRVRSERRFAHKGHLRSRIARDVRIAKEHFRKL